MLVICKVETFNQEDIDHIEKMEQLGIPIIEKSIKPVLKNFIFNTEDIKSVVELEPGWLSIQYNDDNTDKIKGDFNKLIKYLKQEGIIISI